MALLQKAYLGATPLFRQLNWYEDGAPIIVNKPNNAVPVADTAAHTKGAWTQIIASTSADASFLILNIGSVGATATNTATLLDIATGASGSETAIASNIAIGAARASTGGPIAGSFVGFPCKIPSGTRLSCRIQSVVTGGKTAVVGTTLVNAGDYANAPTTVDVLGTSTATSQGTSFSGSSGSWTEVVSSTSQAYRAVAMLGSAHDSDTASITVTLGVGVGASGSEVEFGSTFIRYDNNETCGLYEPWLYLFGRNIPAGSRLAVKHNIAANPAKYGVTLIGIP